MCGAGCHGAADELRDLSDRLKAPLIHSVKGKDIMPYDDPRWMGGIGMIGTKAVYDAVMHCDLLLMVGHRLSLLELPADQAGRGPDRRSAGGARATRADRLRRRWLGAADPEAAAGPGRGEDGHRVLRRGDQGAPQVGRDAGPAGRSGPQQGSHPSAGGGADGRRPRRARRGLRLRHRAQHPLVRQLDSSERLAADHRLVQQRGRRHRRSARPTASRPWTVRARSSRSAATAASTC